MCRSRPGPNNVDMHLTESLPCFFAEALRPVSIFAAPRSAVACDMGLKRQKVSSDSAMPARNGVSETLDAEQCFSLLLAKHAAADARAEAALNSGAMVPLVPLASTTAKPATREGAPKPAPSKLVAEPKSSAQGPARPKLMQRNLG